MKVKSESEVTQSCSNPQRPRGLQPSRLLHPWDFPGKSTGVGCHCLLRHTPTEKYNFFLFSFINKHFAVLQYKLSHDMNEYIQNTEGEMTFQVRINEVSNSILRPFLRQYCDLSADYILCPNSGDCANIRETLAHCSSPSCWCAFFWGGKEDSCLPFPGWKITFPQGSDDEGKEKVTRNQRADGSFRCLY